MRPAGPIALTGSFGTRALSIIEAADHAGFEVGLSVLGIADQPLPVRHGKWHLSRLMARLAALDVQASYYRALAELEAFMGAHPWAREEHQHGDDS